MTNSNKGKKYKSEKIEYEDPDSGNTIWQMTSAPANHQNIYMTKTCFTADSKAIVFLSKRTGIWNMFKADVSSGEIVQLSDFDQDVGIYSQGILPDGRIYAIFKDRLFTLDINTLEEKTLFETEGLWMGEMATVAHHSQDGKYIVVKVKNGEKIDIVTIPTDGSEAKTVFTEDHPMGIAYIFIMPDSKHIVHHKLERQIWCMDIDGKNNRPLYGHEADIWTTHPTCLGNDKVLFSEWPYAIKNVNIIDRKVETICEFNGWHMGIHPDKTKLVCDTTNPDTGIWEVDIKSGGRKLLCKSNSKFPAIETREGPWLDLWAHPHPSYSPDGKMVIFNSCMDGKYTHLYIALVEE